MRRHRLLLLFLVLLAAAPSATAQAKGPLVTFEQALELARKGYERFKIAEEERRRAGLARTRAWAALLPALSTRGTFTHSDREISRPVGGQDVVFLKQDALAGSVTASLNLFKGPAVPELLRAYRLDAAAEQTHRWTQGGLEFEVARAYYAALAAENLVAAAERTLKSAGEHLEAARARRQAGEALAIDVTRARIEVVKARSDLVQAKNALASAVDLLAFLLGRDPPLSVARPTLGPGSSAVDRAAGRPPGRRPDLRAQALRVEAARRALTGAWLDYLPSLSVAWQFAATQNTGFSGEPTSWNLVFALDWVLFDGGLRRATRKERVSLLREGRLEQRLLQRQARQEVRQARRDLRTARVKLETAQEQLQLAQTNRQLVLSRFRAGLGTSLEQVEADDALRQAEVAVVAGELDRALKGLALYRALGLDPGGRSTPAS